MLRRKQPVGILSLLGLTLVGCETTNPHEILTVTAPISALKQNKTIQPQVAQAFILLKEGKYAEASTYINQTLQSQPKSVIFHVLNALTYEKLAEQGDVTGLELAVIGYQNAISMDPFNSFAIAQLGKLKYREQQYDQAQEHFANALLIKPNDPDLIHEFAAASYYAYDIKSAIAAIQKAEKLKPDDPLIQRSAAMMYAAVGEFKTAEKHFNLFQAKMGDDPEVAHVAGRFNDWQSLYKSGRLIMAADKSTSQNSDSTPKDSGSKDATGKAVTTTTTTTTTTTDSGSTAPETTASTPKDSGSKDTTSKDSSSAPSPSDTTSKDTSSSDTTSKDSSSSPSTADTTSKDTTSSDTTSKDSSSSPSTSDTTSKDTTSKDSVSSGSGGPDSANKDSGGKGGLSIDEPAPSESETTTKDEFSRGNIAQNIVETPVAASLPKGPETPTAKQIIVDCYILQITEIAGTSKGHNILDNLAVTLNPGSWLTYKGSLWGTGATPATPTSNSDKVNYTADSGFAATLDINGKLVNTTFQPSISQVNLNNTGSVTGRIFTAGLSWAGLTYSLNIANAADNRTEIVSRPTLMTYVGKESKFFSGTELVNVSGGTYGSNLSRYQVGVGLGILPETLNGDVLTLSLSIESSLLQNTNPNLLATVDVSKTRVDTTARVRLGETIMLGGIYERTEVDIQHGFPGLRDIPFVQYFFSEQVTLSQRRSIVLLLTPRSPDTVKSAVNRAMTRESVRPHLSELEARNPDWFNPETNAINIFSYINLDPILYYEFRTGDVLPPSWGYDVVLNDKLAELSSFLYY